MEILNFFIVAVVSTVIAAAWLFLTRVFPAYKAARIQGSLAVLTRCLAHLSRGPLAEAALANGGYLHDRFYKMAFMVLTHKINLKFRAIFTATSGSDFERAKFHREMESLDSETRQAVVSAVRSMARIFFFRNPFIFLITIVKQIVVSRDFKKPASRDELRNRAAKSAESLALVGIQNRDYAFIPLRH